ncbi:MAG: YigZ family protein [Bacteroidota bacterium]
MSDDQYTYKIIQKTGEGLYKEKGSKFLSFVFHVSNEEEIRERLEELRKTYYDARHHCYAYILGLQQEHSRANDDGEPGHSAGDPILGQIKSFGLTNTLVVVIRYFGGTKLGVSGLITAYKTAAAEALEKSEIIQKHIIKHLQLRYPYDSTNQVMRLIPDFDMEVISQEYLSDCQMTLAVKIPMVEQVKNKLQLLNDTGTAISSEWEE